jgi:hypothetical protein
MNKEYKVYHDVGVLKATLELLLLYNYVDKYGKDMIERTLKDVEKKMSDD